MQKILHIPNYYKPHIGGIEQTCHDIVESCKNKFEQKVICFSENSEDKIEIIDDIEVTKCGVWKKIASQSISFSYPKKLKEIINNFNPDIVIFHYPNPYVSHYLRKILLRKKCKLVLWYHADIIKQKSVSFLLTRQTKWLLNRAEVIISTSPIYPQFSENLKKHSDKVKVIPSCINEERLYVTEEDKIKAKKIKEQYENKKIIFAFGRHVKYKGLIYLVESAELINKDAVILIGGKGPLTDELKSAANRYDNIHFLGRISDEDLKGYLLAMDIYAFPSITKNEAFGLSLAEGMYFGRPAVTFTIEGSGVNYVSINNVTGLEVENSNYKELAKAINKLLEDDKLREELGNNARMRVYENFLFNKFKENVLELLEEETKNESSN